MPLTARPTAVARRLLGPVQAFVSTEASGGILLLAAALVALAWANSPWDGSYADLWHAGLEFDFAAFAIRDTLGHLVNDGLMAIFFFVVGLEIKRELVRGELRTRRQAALPVVAALGGMAVPALIYAAWNAGGSGASGWGIPMATDIAFALGVLALLGPRIPFGLKVFLLALAIVDDLGAIVVIALFYTGDISLEALGWAAAVLALIVALNRAGVRGATFYVIPAFFFWAAFFESGIHATLAGVVLAFLVPSRPHAAATSFEPEAATLLEQLRAAREAGDIGEAEAVLQRFEALARDTEAPLDSIERALHPWVSYLIVPVFALANAGVDVSGEAIGDAAGSAVSLGIASGLLLGKPAGILLFSWLAVRLGWATLPEGVTWRAVLGAGLLAGIGFTVSLFITNLAFEDTPGLFSEAKLGILAASAIAGVAGFLLLRATCPASSPVIPPPPVAAAPPG
ncbi:MAG: Na+/H+ antiporter NhaA [Tepidiformaceae bacterium]